MLTTNEQDWFIEILERLYYNGTEIDPTDWQSQDISSKQEMAPIELTNHTLKLSVTDNVSHAQERYRPNLPWAEDHFLERVGGEPLNPPPSEKWWPFAILSNQGHKHGQIFSHTYPERFWPKLACTDAKFPNLGVRYPYGDLDDVVAMLTENPLTRQAYLPIWFPEDTGAVEGQRVPCSLGYQFMFRPTSDGSLNGVITYFIRSCDALRHLKDDAYMAARLLQWVVGKLQGNGIKCQPSMLVMNITSLHIFKGDIPMVKGFLDKFHEEAEEKYGYGV